ncbi:MAG: glucose-1-phosphate adenylyltransferase [Spirochaeta sp.]|nr:glucose-1-phosphate adenylyltransferase [Spirochaeta sp.]
MAKVLTVVLGGGRGERLFPLTRDRAKPAVPFGAKYRLVDVPISNAINSGFKQIYILTQFNSTSLHNHIAHTYIFDSFSRGFVEILAAEQTFERSNWYRGTADAVRQNFMHLRTQSPTHYLILSGDQLYRMDLKDFLVKHLESSADVSVAVTPISQEKAHELGILKIDSKGRIVKFMEKPDPADDISEMKMPDTQPSRIRDRRKKQEYLASMGIYIFNAAIMEEALNNELEDFGKHIIPASIEKYAVNSYIFPGFWEDIGTIKSFYQANIDLCSIAPKFNFYDELKPIYTRRRDLPASKINHSTITLSLTADGCIINNSNIMNSIIGIRTLIESGASLDGVVCMGKDFYETDEQKEENHRQGNPDMGIGRGSIICKAIIDKNVRIGESCRIGIDNRSRPDGDYGNYYIKDGIIIIPKNTTLPPGTVI